MRLCVTLNCSLYTSCALCTFKKIQIYVLKVQVSASAAIRAGGWFVGFRNSVNTAACWLPAYAFVESGRV